MMIQYIEDGMTQPADKGVIPYLMHFGEIKISPEVLRLDEKGYAVVRRREGLNMHEYIERRCEVPKDVCISLARKIAYINKYDVRHGIFTPRNVVMAEGNGPVIIDWKDALIGDPDGSDVETFLAGCKENGINGKFEKLFRQEYDRELRRQRILTDEQIMEKYNKLLESCQTV